MTDRIIYTVTRSVSRLKFEDIKKLPSEDGPLSICNEISLDIASSIFGSYCTTIESGCVQIFDVIDEREIGYFFI